MKKLFFIIGLFFSLSAAAQPTNYTKINMRYRWLSGMFDSALYVPRYNGTPSGVRVNETSVFDGMVAMDTTNNRLYIYSGGAWVRLANYSEIAAYTAGNGLTLSGSQFKLGGTLTENTTITTTGYDFNLVGIPTTSSTTGKKVYLLDTVTGKSERIDAASLGGSPGGSNKQFQYNNAGSFAGSSIMTQETDQILITGSGSTTPLVVDGHEDLTGEIINVTQSSVKKFSFHSNGAIELQDVSAPATPASGYGRVYVKTDSLRFKNDAGTEFTLGTSGGGGSQSLQQVTDVGYTTTDSLVIGTDNSSQFIANTDTVVASGYDGINTGAGNIGSLSAIYFFNEAQRSRIRQTGTITKIKLYLASKPAALTGLYFDVWRKDGSTWDSVAHVPILDLVSGGTTNTITLPYNVNVLEGDYTGLSYTASAGVSLFITATSTSGGGWYATSAPSWTDYNWTAQAGLDFYVPIQVFMQAPVIVSIGNSIMSGYSTNYTFVEQTENNNWTTTTPYKVADTLNVSHQNMAIAGQTTTQILARFSADVVALKPKYVIIEGGVNDVDNGVATTTIKSNWAAIIDSCVVNDIVPVVLGIYPWSNGSNSEMQKVDSINNYLDSLCATIPSSIRIDVAPYIGEFRSGGDVGNLWDLQAIYDVDGVHINELGNGRVASAILDSLFREYPTKYYTGVITEGDSTYNLPFRSGTILVDNDLNTVFGTGLTYTAGVATANISAGVSGGQTIYGGTAANDDLTIQGTSNATKTTSYVNIQPSGGRVGIGTLNPTNTLQVTSSDAATMTMVLQNTNSGSTGFTQMGFRNNLGNKLFNIGYGNSGETFLGVKNSLYFYDSSAAAVRMVIDSNGKVGVTTVSPASKLDVSGSFGAAINTTTTDVTLNDTHHTLIITGGTPTITLPAAASTNTRRIYVIVNQTGSGVTISSYLDFTGAGNTTVAANSAIKIQSNGTSWYRIL